jgi:hypothetical protein
MDIQLQDILIMKKGHPCGSNQWLVLRTGVDFRLRCMGCGHEIMTPRHKALKNIRTVTRPEKTSTD